MKLNLVTTLLAVLCYCDAAKRKFPENFMFGAATASYQIEGGWNSKGKGENIWDHLTHTTDLVQNGDTGDVACDSYNQYERDVEMLVELGVDYYRFSMSWTRILPTGFTDAINPDGIRYYNALIDELLAYGITPMVTIYHWDLPQGIQDLGGWTNPITSDYYADYADVLFDAFGDRVKHWLTLNEPMICCSWGYGNAGMAPAANMSGIGDYLCSHTMLMAHAKAYHRYQDKYKAEQKGKVGLTLNANWIEPTDRTPEGIRVAEEGMQFELGWFANPIFSAEGDYPRVMREKIAKRSREQGFAFSRLPQFTKDEIDYVKGTADFFGLNHYSTSLGRKVTDDDEFRVPSYDDDRDVVHMIDETWPSGASWWLKVVPWGFTNILEWITKTYDAPEIIIFENGYSDRGEMQDTKRMEYYNLYLNAMLDAMEKGAKVIAYTAWSLMDNFEWLSGYSERFGLFHVDYSSPQRTRTPKASASYYREIIETKSIDSAPTFG